VFELGAEEAIDVREATLRLEDLLGADEAFITSTTRNITPVVRVGDQAIGTGKPGAVTGRLIAAFRAKAARVTQDVGDSA
jgi:branched-subunit amino acid aminotransferase/4-amino-4-deoxychorismate lyase